MCNISKGIVEKSVARGLAQGIAQGIEQGIAQGMEQGIAQGMEQGMEMKTLETIRNLMRNTQFTLEQAMAAIGLTQEEQTKYSALLRQ